MPRGCSSTSTPASTTPWSLRAPIECCCLRARSGVGLDIALGGLPIEESAVARSSLFTFPPDVPLRTCSAEDLIVFKAFADRPKDWVDIDGVLIRQAAPSTGVK